MERTQVYLTPEERQGLAAISKARATSVASVIRAAVDLYLEQARADDWHRVLDETFGCAPELGDGVVFQRALREGWGRRSDERVEGG